MLVELQSNDDPVWTYFDNHHRNILDRMNKVYRASVSTIEGALKETFSHPQISAERLTANAQKSKEDTTLSETQSGSLQMQLCAAIADLEEQKPDAVIGM